LHDARREGGADGVSERGRYRWVICGLLFLATTVNYVDRAVLGILKPLLDADLGWSQQDYGWVVIAFQAAYAVGYLAAGGFVDRVGVRRGFAAAVFAWGLAAMAHALVRTVGGFATVRAGLGLAEGGSFPAAVKAVAEWFPREERALATGLFNAGSNAGAIACPLLVPWLAGRWGWPGAFLATGALGFAWLAAWLWLYRPPEEEKRLGAEERAWILKDPEERDARVPWRSLLGRRQTWAFMVGMAASSPVWWFYVYWTPDFLKNRFGLGLADMSLPLATVFLVSSIGGVAGGWLSSALLRRGWSLNAARKTALLACALAVLPVWLTPRVPGVWIATSLVALAAAAHCGYAANLFTLVSDTCPRRVISSVVGIGGMAGALAGMAFARFVSVLLDLTANDYRAPFAVAALSYLAGLAVIHALLPRLEPMREAA
jgi:ACS family hexuronate transporter-like MFS transporter